MLYKKFAKDNWESSILGLGCMRLPVLDDDNKKIDEEKAIEMIRYAVDNGINYLDTAWPYHGENSEVVLGKALQDGYREKTKIATKLPSWSIEEEADFDKYFNKQLEKLQTDHVDLYLLHSLSKKYWKNYKELDVFSWLDQKKKEGKINYVGFSFHDDYDLFEEIINYYDWDFCQIQYNYLDTEFQAGKKGLKYAHKNDVSVVVMEPLRGGTLAKTPPSEVKNILDQSNSDRNAVEWSLQWLWNQKEVNVVLSGMSTLEQIKENIMLANKADHNKLNNEELKLVNKARKKFLDIFPVACTGCNYCIPCPEGVAIPNIFSLYNEAIIYDDYKTKNERYSNFKEKSGADNCVECGQCEEACPQSLTIIKYLKDVSAYFD